MSEEYPEFVEPLAPYCLVRARIASIHADGPDDGSNPDWMPAVNQKVVFTPSISGQLLTYAGGTDDEWIVTVEPVEATTNADGWFVSMSGKRIYLLATDDPQLNATGWTWSVNINRRDIRFSAPSGGVVDLASFITAPAVDATKYASVVQIVADYITANPPDVEQAVADYLTANPPATAPDATTAAKGLIRLAGDLAGTADAPTVPGLADKADTDHTHTLDDVTDYSPPDLSGYATTTALASGLSGKSDSGHGHALGDVSGLQTALDGKQPAGSYATATHNHDGTYAPAGHDHDGVYAPALGADDNYVTDAEKAALHSHANKTALDAVSGTNTGDQDLSGYATTASLATVATSGSYADLTGTPTIPDSPDDIGAAPATQPINAQTTAYTLAASDVGKLIPVTAASAVDVTVPSGVFTAGQRVDVLDLGAERVTFVAGASMTLTGTPSLVSRAQYSAHSIIFLSSTEAVVVGDLA